MAIIPYSQRASAALEPVLSIKVQLPADVAHNTLPLLRQYVSLSPEVQSLNTRTILPFSQGRGGFEGAPSKAMPANVAPQSQVRNPENSKPQSLNPTQPSIPQSQQQNLATNNTTTQNPGKGQEALGLIMKDSSGNPLIVIELNNGDEAEILSTAKLSLNIVGDLPSISKQALLTQVIAQTIAFVTHFLNITQHQSIFRLATNQAQTANIQNPSQNQTVAQKPSEGKQSLLTVTAPPFVSNEQTGLRPGAVATPPSQTMNPVSRAAPTTSLTAAAFKNANQTINSTNRPAETSSPSAKPNSSLVTIAEGQKSQSSPVAANAAAAMQERGMGLPEGRAAVAVAPLAQASGPQQPTIAPYQKGMDLHGAKIDKKETALHDQEEEDQQQFDEELVEEESESEEE